MFSPNIIDDTKNNPIDLIHTSSLHVIQTIIIYSSILINRVVILALLENIEQVSEVINRYFVNRE